MRHGSCGLLAGWGLGALLLGVGIAQATTFNVNVTISSALLSGGPAVLVFDLIDGEVGPPDNTVTLSAISSKNGLQGSAYVPPPGNVTGTGPWTFSDAGDSFFNELQVSFDPTGTVTSFSFTTTDNPPLTPSPDEFSFFILNPDLSFLITTNDPTNALFAYDIGVGAAGLRVFTPDQAGFSFSVTPAQAAPEPTSLALLAAGLLALLPRKRLMPTLRGRLEKKG